MPMHPPTMSMHLNAMLMCPFTMPMHLDAMLMRPSTMPMHLDAMLMRPSTIKTLRFYAKVYLVKRSGLNFLTLLNL